MQKVTFELNNQQDLQLLLQITDRLGIKLVDTIKPQQLKKRAFGSMKGLVQFISDDFDAPLDAFKEYRPT
jgi:hypothetical protein